MKNTYLFGLITLLFLTGCTEMKPEIIDNYECDSQHSVQAIANRGIKTDFKEGDQTLDIMAGELCDCFCQIQYDSLTKENIESRIDKDFMAWDKADDPVIAAFIEMIACKNYLRGDRGGYQAERDGYEVVQRYKKRCAGVEAKRSYAEGKLRYKIKEIGIDETYLDMAIE